MALRALVVDDTPPLRRLVRVAMERIQGMEVVEAADGAEGLRKFAGDRFDIVLADVHMPVMDGVEMIRAIRAGADPERARVPIVVITADETEEERAMAAGATAYTVKPIQVPRLVATVRKALGLAQE